MITHVAIRWDGRIWSLPRPYRHHHVIETISRLTGAKYIDCRDDNQDQGFLDDTGRYVNRVDGLAEALKNKQVKDENDIRHGMLFSEDLW